MKTLTLTAQGKTQADLVALLKGTLTLVEAGFHKMEAEPAEGKVSYEIKEA